MTTKKTRPKHTHPGVRLGFTIAPAGKLGRDRMMKITLRWGMHGLLVDLPTIPVCLVSRHAALLEVVAKRLRAGAGQPRRAR